MKSVYTVILNYNNYEDTKECVDSIKKITLFSEYKNYIVLVDNNSNDDSREKLFRLYDKEIVCLKSDINCGYAAGNNIGIKYALEKGADYICVLNNDTVAYEDFFSPCLEFLSKHSDVAFISPTIENYANDLVQSTGGDIIFKKGLVTVKNNGFQRSALPEQVESDYIGGACLIFKSNLIKKIDFIPECYFLFFEETEWCWKAKKIGMKNVCLNTTAIKHKGSASIDTVDGLHAYLMERNRVVFLRRNASSRLVYMKAISFLTIKYIKKGILEDRKYFKYLKYMNDGYRNVVDEKYPFVYMRN